MPQNLSRSESADDRMERFIRDMGRLCYCLDKICDLVSDTPWAGVSDRDILESVRGCVLDAYEAMEIKPIDDKSYQFSPDTDELICEPPAAALANIPMQYFYQHMKGSGALIIDLLHTHQNLRSMVIQVVNRVPRTPFQPDSDEHES